MTDQATASTNPVNDFIAQTVAQNDVVLFMKGTPDAPRCGFSSLAVQILDHLQAPFVGGSDIVREMFQAGELKTLMDEKGVTLGEA